MHGLNRFLTLTLLLGLTAAVCGCHVSQASTSASTRSAGAAYPIAVGGVSSTQTAKRPSKQPPRDSEFTVYNNLDYGISFRYPRHYFLNDSMNGVDAYSEQAVRHLASEQPGAKLVAIVSLPGDAYANTTFVGATLQFIVNPVATPQVCRSFAAPPDDTYSSGSTNVQNLAFDWRERGSAAGGTGYVNRDYAGFSNDICYEFFLEVVVGSNPDADVRIKVADTAKIMRILEKIVSSFRVEPDAGPSNPPSLPIIRSFTVEPLPEPHIFGVIRVSWDISGAGQDEVFLRVNCPDFAQLNPLPDRNSSSADALTDPYVRPTYYRLESIFSCGVFTPVPAASGSFRLQVENGPVTLTLFVYHLDYLTRPSAF